jgi:hypothetical protein
MSNLRVLLLLFLLILLYCIVDAFRNCKIENGVAVNGPLCKKVLGCTNNALVAVPRGMFGEKECKSFNALRTGDADLRF